MLKRAWLKCWHDEFLIAKAARLVVQNAAATKIQVLYRDYRTRSKTAQLLAQKKKALLAKFVYQGRNNICNLLKLDLTLLSVQVKSLWLTILMVHTCAA
jgi:hypothetical protein